MLTQQKFTRFKRHNPTKLPKMYLENLLHNKSNLIKSN
jgi:hypothetical protein